MRLLGYEVSIPSLVLATLVLALVVALGVSVATTGAAFAPYNSDWQGASDLRTTADESGVSSEIVTEMDRYRAVDANDSVAFVLAPESRSASDRATLRSFVQQGGRLVVATSDPESGNELLSGLGTDVRVVGPTLRDDVESLHGPGFPMVSSTANHSAVRNTTGLALNFGTALTVDGAARPIANSSSFSYLDEDGNEAPSDGESLESRPVIASQSMGSGEVIVVSDPSVFINAMLDHDPNRNFVANLVEDRDRALLDRTNDGVPPLRAALIWLRGHPAGPALLGLSLVGVILAWERGLVRRFGERGRRLLPGGRGAESGRGSSAGGSPGELGVVDREALDAYLADRYPEWEPEQRRRVLGGVITDDLERDDDATVD